MVSRIKIYFRIRNGGFFGVTIQKLSFLGSPRPNNFLNMNTKFLLLSYGYLMSKSKKLNILELYSFVSKKLILKHWESEQ